MTTATQKIPTGYKQTDIGVIPADWDVKRLGDIAPLQRGFDLPSSQLQMGPYPVVYSNGVLNFHNKAMSKAPGVVTGRSGTIGKVNYIEQDYWPHNTTLWVTNFKGNDEKYIYFLYSHLNIERFSTGSGVPTLNRNDVHDFRVTIPSNKKEQSAIATALSDSDALIEKLEKLIEKKKNIKQGAMQELLTGKRRLPGFSGEWKIKNLGDLANIKTGGRNNQDKIEDGQYPFFVRSATIERINSYSHDCEAVLVPGEGNIGKIFHYINGRFDVHQRVYAITEFIQEASGKFIFYYMDKNFGAYAMQNTVKATVDSLRLPTFENFQVNLPPTKEEQIAIATVLSDMDTEIEKLESQLAKYQNLKQGMMQTLLTGKIRLLSK